MDEKLPGVPDPPHPRDLQCQEAGTELVAFINDWRRRHNLTNPEFLWLMLTPVTAYVQQMGIIERDALLRGVKPG